MSSQFAPMPGDGSTRRAEAPRSRADNPASRRPTARLRLLTAAVGGAIALSGTIAPSAALAAGPAADGPGALSHFGLARKDCFGTARNRTSKVWYTVADGILSDVYYPTIDNTNVETLQYVVTDGATFTDLQARDMTHTTSSVDPSGMECRITSTAKNGRYRLQTDYVTDPSSNSVIWRTTLTPLVAGNYRVFVRLDATVNGNGGGGAGNGGPDSALVDTSKGHPIAVSYDTSTTSNAVNRDYAEPVFLALDGPFSTVESGFVGAPSDGLTQLDSGRALSESFATAANGNVVQTAQVATGGTGPMTFTLGLGFGASQAQAVNAIESSLGAGFPAARKMFEAGWAAYDAALKAPPKKLAGLSNGQSHALGDLYYTSANVIKAAEDKTFPGAIVAAPASPWGQAVSAGDPNNLYFGSYREVFARDLYEAWTGLVAAGDLTTARDAVTFLFTRQQMPDGSMPRNSLVNGKVAPDSFGTQLDETAYPILMANELRMTDHALYTDHIRPAAFFIASHGPAFGAERWEEQNGFSPSTIAAEVAGLIAAADLATANGDLQSAQLFRGVADDWQRSVESWTVTTNGPLSGSPYYIRLSKSGDPNEAVTYNVGNGGPTLDQRAVIDAGFLELVRLGLESPTDATILNSLQVVDGTIKSTTPSGPGWHRYNGDGYGDRAGTGAPWAPSGQGTGHVWPVLSVERAEHALVSGGSATVAGVLASLTGYASGIGLIPEQDWELPDLAASSFGTDPTVASIGFANGKPAGSAAPLVWSAGAAVRLIQDVSAGRLLDRPANTTERYVTNQVGQTTLTVSSPTDLSPVFASPVTVTGTTAVGNTVFVAATNTDANSQTTIASGPAASDGTYSIDVAVIGGTTVLNVVAVSPSGATAHATRTVVFDFVPGTSLIDVTDPDGDDNGPGNYAYPTSSDFHAGAFDLQRFQVIDDGTNIIFRVQTRDLSPTFGSSLGAQLVDVYVHDPAAVDTTVASSFPQRNYEIAAGGAWNRLLEVQGFGQRYVDAHGASLGTISIHANQVSRFITFSVPKSSLGTPGPGWGFTVVLTGQDGFSPDQARGFASTPQAFQFGVCAAASPDPHCTVDPSSVPKAVDVIAPAGVLQSDELDYTVNNPVVIQPVAIP
ncbi:MAG TPA: glucodextranase DOMON-like domain-containing protein [Candidatus Limnocylindrales bacterium]|nr:glucodextranase DOMON-like domain-containing protein [Candidatus Limnocylindrales bacterium]